MKTLIQITRNILNGIYAILKINDIKKYIFIFLLLTSISSFISAQDCNCKHIIAADQLIVDANKLNIQPGDTVCIQASIKRMLMISNFHGTPEKYIVFINY